MRRIACAIFVVLITVRLAGSSRAQTLPATRAASGTPTPAAVVVLHGAIDDWSAAGMMQRIDRARADGARTIILQINTWGGQVTSALEMSSYLKRQRDLHIIAYVDDKAISAGALLAIACDEIVMQPGSKIGDCAPIIASSDGMQTVGETERAKMESPILSDFYESSIRNRHDPLLTSAMVTIGKTVHFIENTQTGEKRFVDDAEYATLTSQGAVWRGVKEVPNPLDSPSSLLTLHAELAQRVGLASGLADSPASLAQERGLTLVNTYSASAGESAIGWLNSAMVRSLLTLIFMASVYTAFSHPGHGMPEAIAASTLVVLVGIPLMTGYASWLEISAIVLGLVLVALEIFVIPGFGIPGIAGIILTAGGLIMTFVGKEPVHFSGGWLPTLDGTWDAIRNGLISVVGGSIGAMFLWFWVTRYISKLPYLSRMVLPEANTGVPMGDVAMSTAAWPRVGDIGQAVTDLKPGGMASFMDDATGDARHSDVVSETGFVERNQRVVVKIVEGNRVVVRRL